MAIEFEREIVQSRILDPRRDFEEDLASFERRVDPLTGQTSITSPTRPLFKGRASKPDLSGVIERSLAAGCPFCPQAIDKLVPKFPLDFIPKGRIRLGESCLFPQMLPVAPYSALAVLSNQHFIGLPDFTNELLVDGFSVCQTYLRRVFEYDPQAKYYSIFWNYMPPSGASQLHPHLQPFADYIPGHALRTSLEASQQYCQSNGANFWSDLIAKEISLGERYIEATGNVFWLSSFAPITMSGIDIIAIFQGRSSFLDLSEQDLEHFSQGLKRLFRYISDQNIYSFNLCLYSGIRGEDCFWTHARIVSRLATAPLDFSDVGGYQMLVENHASLRLPEDICRELKVYF